MCVSIARSESLCSGVGGGEGCGMRGAAHYVECVTNFHELCPLISRTLSNILGGEALGSGVVGGG